MGERFVRQYSREIVKLERSFLIRSWIPFRLEKTNEAEKPKSVGIFKIKFERAMVIGKVSM